MRFPKYTIKYFDLEHIEFELTQIKLKAEANETNNDFHEVFLRASDALKTIHKIYSSEVK